MSTSSQSGTSILDYPGAVDRIADAEVDPDSIFASDVISDLIDSDHVTREVAQDIAEGGVPTVEGVQAELEKKGEIPSVADIQAAIESDTLDGVSDSVRSQNMAADLDQIYVTEEDVSDITAEIQARAGDETQRVYREDVADEIADRTNSKQWVGGDETEISESVADRIGAPTKEAVQQAGLQALTSNQRDVTAENTPGYNGSGERVSVITNTSGETVGVLGSGGAAGAVAEQEGVETLTGGTEAFGLSQGGGKATLTLNGEPIREVDVS